MSIANFKFVANRLCIVFEILRDICSRFKFYATKGLMDFGHARAE